MAPCRKKKKTCRTVCRNKCGRFKRCGRCDRRYSVRIPRRRGCKPKPSCPRRRKTCGGGGKSRYMTRCRSRCGSFKRCSRCDKRWRVRKRSRSRSCRS